MIESTDPIVVDCLVKLGGAALTIKTQFETLNASVLENTIASIASLKYKNLIIVHGAGSFGHIQAAKYNIAGGGDGGALEGRALLGCAKTRESVLKLNQTIVSMLIRHNVPAIGVSPLSLWTTKNRNIVEDSPSPPPAVSLISSLLRQGFVPVIHGDVVLDQQLKFTILGGDPIMKDLCRWFRPVRFAVFLTNVDGIFDRPPDNGDAKLLRRIIVDGSSTGVWRGELLENGEITDSTDVRTDTLKIDTTGGIAKKIEDAIRMVPYCQTPVRIAKAGTKEALEACTLFDLPMGWKGTEVVKVLVGNLREISRHTT